jgi:isopentenyl diphosphate isomerase/L-lactate dehydrogenase-like FMN-dependent dehydrogenase
MSLDIKTIRQTGREKLKGYCRVCPICDGRACSGEVPGMGGVGSGGSFRVNLEALAEYRFRLRAIHQVKETDTSMTLWDQKLSLPLMAAPMTGTTYNMGGKLTEEEFVSHIVSGSIDAGTIGFTGDGADPSMFNSGIKALKENNGLGAAIIKPRAQKEIISRIKKAEEAGAIAVGVDIDGAGLITMAQMGQAVGPKSIEEIRKLVESTDLPFVLKGIMTPEDALAALEAGVSAIVVSNHGGRVLDSTMGAAHVLAEISSVVRGRMIVIADGGVRFGGDILKLLALGADAVLVGRPLITGAFGGGKEGVSLILKKMGQELIQTMLLTGTSSVSRVNPEIIERI